MEEVAIGGPSPTVPPPGSSRGEAATPRLRVLMAKPGLDGHDRGAKIVVRGLRDAGMEVIYTGLRQTPEMIVGAAVTEDVNVICLSILSGAHLDFCRRLREGMVAAGIDDIPLVVGGIVPPDDILELERMGVSAVLGPGSTLVEAVRVVSDLGMTAP